MIQRNWENAETEINTFIVQKNKVKKISLKKKIFFGVLFIVCLLTDFETSLPPGEMDATTFERSFNSLFNVDIS